MIRSVRFTVLALALAFAACGNNEAQLVQQTGSADQLGTLPDDIAYALKALPDARVQQQHRDGIPAFVTGDLGTAQVGTPADVSVTLQPALTKIAPVFRLSAQNLRFTRQMEDALGLTHVRFEQTKNGLDVVGGDLLIHLKQDGTIYAVNGEARDGVLLPAQAKLSEADALAAAMEQVGKTPSYSGARLTYVIATSDQSLHLAWEILAEGEMADLPMKDLVYIDAVTGQLVDRRPTIHSALSRRVYTANNGTSLPGTLIRTEGGATTGDVSADKAYDYTGVTYNFYKTWFNRDSYDNAGSILKSTVHYGNKYNNAYWDGTQMVFGDGDGVDFSPFSRSLDVTAHELTHAVTEHTANLAYQNEPGALNEAMSDIMAASTESWNDGSVNSDTWKVGEDIYTPGTAGDALRYMDNPTADGQSYDYYPERYTGTQDYGGVHLNSGIANLAFKLLVTGGTHPRNKTTTQVPALGMDKATRIFYRALANYMTSNTTFQDARTATKQAATDLYTATEVAAVDATWTAVGVPGGSGGGGGGGGGGTTTALTNGTPVSNLSGASGSQVYFTLQVPSGASGLSFKMSGGSGDADLYVKFGSAPTTSSYDYRPYLNGNNETVNVTTATAGTWYVMIRGYSSYSGVSLVGSYSTSSGGGGNVLQNGVPIVISGSSGSTKTWSFSVPSGASSLTFKISGGSGDADLYVKYGSAPTTSSWDYRPYLYGNNETVNATPTAGTWYVMVRGYSSYSNVTLVATYQ